MDFDDYNSMLSFDMFLVRFETMILDTLIDNRKNLFGSASDNKSEVLGRVLKVAARFYDKNLLEKEIAHSINRVISSQHGHTYAFSVD